MLKKIQVNDYIICSKRKIHETVIPHWHDLFEIENIISRSGIYVINGKVIDIKPGILFVMTPTDFHSSIFENCVIYNIMFLGYVCDPFILSQITSKTNMFAFETAENSQKFIESSFEEITLHTDDIAYCSVILNSVIAKIAKLTHVNLQQKDFSASKRAMFFIMNNFRKSFSLNDIAAYTGLTPTYISEVFKKETGKTMKQYTDDMRLDYARKLLLYSDVAIKQICSNSGFNDNSNFIRRFKDRFGMPPAAFKKKYNSKNEL